MRDDVSFVLEHVKHEPDTNTTAKLVNEGKLKWWEYVSFLAVSVQHFMNVARHVHKPGTIILSRRSWLKGKFEKQHEKFPAHNFDLNFLT